MSNVSGAWYSTVTPMSAAAASTPLAATDQNGSDACPCVTTTKRKSRWFTAPFPSPLPFPSPPSSPGARRRREGEHEYQHSQSLHHRTNPLLAGLSPGHPGLPPRRRAHLLPRPLQEREATPRVQERARPRLGLVIEHLVVFEYVPNRFSGLLHGTDHPANVHVALAQRPVEAGAPPPRGSRDPRRPRARRSSRPRPSDGRGSPAIPRCARSRRDRPTHHHVPGVETQRRRRRRRAARSTSSGRSTTVPWCGCRATRSPRSPAEAIARSIPRPSAAHPAVSSRPGLLVSLLAGRRREHEHTAPERGDRVGGGVDRRERTRQRRRVVQHDRDEPRHERRARSSRGALAPNRGEGTLPARAPSRADRAIASRESTRAGGI